MDNVAFLPQSESQLNLNLNSSFNSIGNTSYSRTRTSRHGRRPRAIELGAYSFEESILKKNVHSGRYKNAVVGGLGVDYRVVLGNGTRFSDVIMSNESEVLREIIDLVVNVTRV